MFASILIFKLNDHLILFIFFQNWEILNTMKKRCQIVHLIMCFLWLVAEAVITSGEVTDKSEIEGKQIKALSKRDANDIDVLSDIDSGKSDDSSLEDLEKQIYTIYDQNLNKRMLETLDDMDFDNFDKFDPPYLVLEDQDGENGQEYYNDNTDVSDDDEEKRGVDRYSFLGNLGKRLRAPMGYGGRLGKRTMLDYDYDKRIPLGFVGALGKRAPMGFKGQLGKRTPMGFIGQLGKRAPMGFTGQLGKRAPMGFTGQLGKRAPLGFTGQLGKRAPLGFYGSLGKRIPIFIGAERRAPMGFMGQLGKRGGPMGFRGQLGKRETVVP